MFSDTTTTKGYLGAFYHNFGLIGLILYGRENVELTFEAAPELKMTKWFCTHSAVEIPIQLLIEARTMQSMPGIQISIF